MEKLNVCLSSLKAVKDGHVSKTRVDAAAEAALRALKHGHSAGEIAEALMVHSLSSSKDQRLAALYALHEVVWREKKKLEEKNGGHRTEKRGSLSMALETRVVQVLELFRDAATKDKDQVAKILQKWSERLVFPVDLCRKCAQVAECAIPTEPTSLSTKKETASEVPISSFPAPPSTSIQLGNVQAVSLQVKPSTLPLVPLLPPTIPTIPATTASQSAVPAPLVTTTTTGKGGGWSTYASRAPTTIPAAVPAPLASATVSTGGGGRDSGRKDDREYRRDSPNRRGYDDRRRSPERREKRSRWDQ